MHKCYLCKEQKGPEDFNKDRTRPSGLMSRCRDCDRERTKAKRRTDEGRAKMVVDSRRWKRANKIKENAHKAVARALKAGKLSRPDTCSRCPSDEHIQGHHPDYQQPLFVIWLCRDCHTNLHRELQRAAR